jgi:hypothetical protein
MASAESGSSSKGKEKVEDVALPVELKINIMEKYVAQNYPVIRIHSVEDFEATIEEIKAKSEATHPWKDLKGPIETALFSMAAFQLDITFTPQVDGSVVARVPAAVSEIKPRIRKLQLTFLSEGPDRQNLWEDGTPYFCATKGWRHSRISSRICTL